MEKIRQFLLSSLALTSLRLSAKDIGSAREDSLRKLLSKPLITGASVSADTSSLSPGKTLALKYTPIQNILTRAEGGRKGKDTLKTLTQKDFKGRSIVIGLDLFFWDSTLPSSRASVAALHRLVKETTTLKIPLILGEIPEILPGHQPQRNVLNKEIKKLCTPRSQCEIMPFNALHKEVMHKGFLQTAQGPLKIQEIIPDGLHLSPAASEHLAQVLRTRIEKIL